MNLHNFPRTSLLLDLCLDVVRSFLCYDTLVVGTVPGPGHPQIRALPVPLTPDLVGDQLTVGSTFVLYTVLHLVSPGALAITGHTAALQ